MKNPTHRKNKNNMVIDKIKGRCRIKGYFTFKDKRMELICMAEGKAIKDV